MKAQISPYIFPGEEKDAEEVAHYIRSWPKSRSFAADLRDKQAPEKLVAQAHEALGGLDTLVLNAPNKFPVPLLKNYQWNK